jgi:hypothetical protein
MASSLLRTAHLLKTCVKDAIQIDPKAAYVEKGVALVVANVATTVLDATKQCQSCRGNLQELSLAEVALKYGASEDITLRMSHCDICSTAMNSRKKWPVHHCASEDCDWDMCKECFDTKAKMIQRQQYSLCGISKAAVCSAMLSTIATGGGGGGGGSTGGSSGGTSLEGVDNLSIKFVTAEPRMAVLLNPWAGPVGVDLNGNEGDDRQFVNGNRQTEAADRKEAQLSWKKETIGGEQVTVVRATRSLVVGLNCDTRDATLFCSTLFSAESSSTSLPQYWSHTPAKPGLAALVSTGKGRQKGRQLREVDPLQASRLQV